MLKVVSEKEVDSSREVIKQLINAESQNWYALTLALGKSYKKQDWSKWGFSNFKKYVTEELNIEYRIAMYKVKMSKYITTYNISEVDVLNIGWTKFKEIAPFLSAEQKSNKDMFELAEKLTVEELHNRLNGTKKGTEEKGFIWRFKFNREQDDILKEAFIIASDILNTDDTNRLLEAILSDWIINHKDKE